MPLGTFLRSGAWLLLIAFSAGSASAQTGRITGLVTDQGTGQPLDVVQVYLDGTPHNAVTQANGRFLMINVPAGTYTLVAERLGYNPYRQVNVVVEADGTATLEITMRVQPLALEAVVATGLADPIEGIKAPFSVGQLTRERIATVPATHSALASIQGKVSGVTIQRGSGQPGSGVSVLLRTPTSIQRNNDPLFVVDGTIIGGGTMDIESLDIESIEVVKGAAAAALYGSQASGGVISITTARGADLSRGQRRVAVHTEYGRSTVPTGNVRLARSHAFRVNADGQYIDESGNVVSREDREVDVVNIMDAAYPGELYDNVNRFYRPGEFMTTNVSVSQNMDDTNFRLSLNRYREAGTIETNDGYSRHNLRVNLDHRFGENFEVNSTLYHNRSTSDELSGRPFWDLLLLPPDINLDVRDENGDFVQVPDEEVPLENPIWRQAQVDNTNKRMRTIASVQARYIATPWLQFRAEAGYDRSNETEQFYTPKGTPESTFDGIYTWAEPNQRHEGALDYRETGLDKLNAAASAHLMHRMGPLTARTMFRALMERDEELYFRADGEDFLVEGVKNLNGAQTENVYSEIEEVRSLGYMAQTALDYGDRYVLDVLLRRDGSSLFGPGARWHDYYRVSGSYLMGREEWWPFPQLNEFKLRYSIGTAGGRPNFSDQYETWSVGSTISKSVLGNRNLRPEHSTEQEYGIDLVALGRYSLQLTYATQRTEDQLLSVPVPAVTGYVNQWANAGSIEGQTWELTFDANVFQTPTLRWNATLIADRSRSRITEWGRPCYFDGYRSFCEGSNLSEMWTQKLITTHSELSAIHANSHDAFQVNDDGYLVAVGAGNSWRDGLAGDTLWGTQVEIDGVTYNWGEPLYLLDEKGSPARVKYGDAMPDVNLGWMNQIQWRNLSIHSHMHAQLGGLIYNATKQRLYQHDRHADLDQAGKPEDLKKTNGYYQKIYNRMNGSDHFVEDGSYLKLRELAVTYRLDRNTIRRLGLGNVGVEALSLGITGRNLWTLTGYSGFDPEVGGLFTRTDSFGYPNGRAFTGTVNIEF